MQELNLFEKIILTLIQSYHKKDLDYAVGRNLSLAQLAITYIPFQIKIARVAAGFMINQNNQLSGDNILRWLDVARPDFAGEIRNSQANMKWFDTQIRQIRQLLWG